MPSVISDRDYMRDPESPSWMAAVKLVWFLGACFVVQSLLTFYVRWDPVGVLGLSWNALREGRVWTLVSFQFLHSVPMPFHVLANALGLYFFGRAVEERIGTRPFLTVYAVGGVLGGLAHVLMGWVLGGNPNSPVVGASAGVCAVVATFCRLFPHRRACFSLYFFPVELPAMVFLWILVAFDAWSALFPTDAVAHFAHLAGYGVGVLAAEVLDRDSAFQEWRARRKTASPPKPRFRVIDGGQSSRPDPAPSSGRKEDVDFVSREIDPILDKIAKDGIHSLTEAERQALEAARRRMQGRS